MITINVTEIHHRNALWVDITQTSLYGHKDTTLILTRDEAKELVDKLQANLK